jgi:predicted TIM-barrel fold metal-dependent hydrolase
MATIDFAPFDADNHYYEALDAFTRYIPKDMAKRCMQWAEIDGKQRFIVGGKINKFIPNPTFDPVSKPGALDTYFRAKKPGGDLRAMFGELDPLPAEYRDRDARLALMDRQHLAGAYFFPTLGVGMEESLRHDVPALLAAFRAFNRWIDDDWGFAYKERIFAAPYITLADPQWAIEELEWALERGLRVLVMRTAPVINPAGGTRSPGDATFDPFWARCAEAGVLVAFHSGDAGYGKYTNDWEPFDHFEAFKNTPLRGMTSDRAPFDMFAALACHGVLTRHPRLKLASIEAGSEWVPLLLKKLQKVYAQQPNDFAGHDPVDQIREQLWVAPFYEDDIRHVADVMGPDHVLFGSDYPHAEGLADPCSFVNDLHGFSDEEVKQVMLTNAKELIGA